MSYNAKGKTIIQSHGKTKIDGVNNNNNFKVNGYREFAIYVLTLVAIGYVFNIFSIIRIETKIDQRINDIAMVIGSNDTFSVEQIRLLNELREKIKSDFHGIVVDEQKSMPQERAVMIKSIAETVVNESCKRTLEGMRQIITEHELRVHGAHEKR